MILINNIIIIAFYNKIKIFLYFLQIGNPCTGARKCFDRVGMTAIRENFHEFYNLGNRAHQTNLLSNAIRKKDIKRKRSAPEKDPQNLYNFIVKDHDIEHDVCRIAFISVYGISDSTVR